eukprot:SAG31_NODE_3248_length_4493_cov_1.923760_3_plen_242_part_00
MRTLSAADKIGPNGHASAHLSLVSNDYADYRSSDTVATVLFSRRNGRVPISCARHSIAKCCTAMADDLISIDLLQRQLAEKDAEIGRVKAKAKRFVVEKLRDVQSSLVQQERRQQQFATLLELAMGPEQDLEAHQDQSEIKIEEVLGPSELKLVYSFREVLAVAATNEKKHAEQIAQVSADRSQLMTQLDTIKAKVNISKYLRLSQNISKYLKTSRNISGQRKTECNGKRVCVASRTTRRR